MTIIKENLGMKSILKYLLKNRVVILSVIDIAIIFWIIWFEGRLQYEPPLDYNMERTILPLDSEPYDMMIIAIVINSIVLVLESRKIRKKKYIKYDLIIAFSYFFFITLCMLWGYFYISTRTHDGVIDEYNTLFRFPIWIFGKESFSRIITVTNLYLSLCVLHICICLFYMYLCVDEYKIRESEESGGQVFD